MMTRRTMRGDHEVLDTLFMNDGIRSSWGSHNENLLFLADHRDRNSDSSTDHVPKSWHVQANQNVGMSPKEVADIQKATDLVAEFAVLKLDNVERLSAGEVGSKL
ncbi:hypothetical protein QBC46DRAFT_379077 [Diplogelasinospora grovesii]|uniref:Uncharacterized protein n=1 Tax=Diplogelasinospora grovesii TaxID=303347 RepID=A0AAN6NBV3_9PEZI|nr:hypothetical protein QBC46DRAFT_379077 [Diplogelasinospora grovesii]